MQEGVLASLCKVGITPFTMNIEGDAWLSSLWLWTEDSGGAFVLIWGDESNLLPQFWQNGLVSSQGLPQCGQNMMRPPRRIKIFTSLFYHIFNELSMMHRRCRIQSRVCFFEKSCEDPVKSLGKKRKTFKKHLTFFFEYAIITRQSGKRLWKEYAKVAELV